MDALDSTEKVLSICAVVFGALLFLIRKWFLPLIKRFKGYFERINNACDRIKYIDSELKPNGGGSIKDKINTISTTLAKVEGRQVKIESRQLSLLAITDKPMFESDAKGGCIWVNHAYCRLFQRTFSELARNGWKVILHPSCEEDVIERWETAIIEEVDFHMTYKCVKASGETINVRCNAYKLTSSSGELLGHIGFVDEVNDLRVE